MIDARQALWGYRLLFDLKETAIRVFFKGRVVQEIDEAGLGALGARFEAGDPPDWFEELPPRERTDWTPQHIGVVICALAKRAGDDGLETVHRAFYGGRNLMRPTPNLRTAGLFFDDEDQTLIWKDAAP